MSPNRAAPERAAARVVLRGQPRARGRARARARRLGDDRHAPARRSRRGCWSPSGSSRCRSRAATVHQIGLPYHWGYRGIGTGDAANDLFSLVLDPNVHIQEVKAATCDIVAGRRPRGAAAEFVAGYRRRPDRRTHERRRRSSSATGRPRAGARTRARVGFFTDTRVCIGCKACEVACKEWNDVPDDNARLHAATPTTTAAGSAPTAGVTSPSSSSRSRSAA